MATKVGEAYLEITARNAKLKTKMQESEKAGRSFTQRMQASLVKFGKVAFVGAIAGFTALTAVMIKATKAAAAEELQTKRLTHQMGRLGVATQTNINRVETLANELQNFTRFGDTETRATLSTLITLSNDFEGSMRNLELAFDIAESGMFDIRTAARYIGLAMTGNVEILGRYVAELKSSTNEQLKFMSSSEKAAFAITLLNQKFGGLARQIGETTAGAWAKLKNAISDAWEALGKGMLDETSGGLDRVTKAVKKSEPSLNKMGEGFSRVTAFAIESGNKVAGIIEAASKTIAGLWQDQAAIQRAEEGKIVAEHMRHLHQLKMEGDKARKAALAAREDETRAALAAREDETKKRLDLLVEEADAEIELTERVARTKKWWAKIEENRRKAALEEAERERLAALADKVALWRAEAEEQDKTRKEARQADAELLRMRMEDIERITKVRAPREVRRQEPAFVGAEQLWKRAMVAGGAEPTIRNVLDETKKQTIIFENMLQELTDVESHVGSLAASGLGLVE